MRAGWPVVYEMVYKYIRQNIYHDTSKYFTFNTGYYFIEFWLVLFYEEN